jgi:hypothetical protein
MPFATADDLSPEAARKKVRALRVAVDDNRDPIAERRLAAVSARERGTFSNLAERWFVAEVKPRLKHPEAVWRAVEKYLVPRLGKLPIKAVRPSDCAGVPERVRKAYPTHSNDLLRFLRAIFAFAIRRHLVERSPVGAFSARLDAGGKEYSRTRALTGEELTALFAAIRKEPSFGATTSCSRVCYSHPVSARASCWPHAGLSLTWMVRLPLVLSGVCQRNGPKREHRWISLWSRK